MADENQFTELWNENTSDISYLMLHLENEDIDELPSTIIQNIQNKILIQKIYKRIHLIEQCFFNPQTLTLENCEQLKHIPGEDWTSIIYTLFRDTEIPQYYILDIYKNEHDNRSVPNPIYIQFLSFRTKMFVKSKLIQHFSLQPDNPIKIYD
jgi:hypothetical protein